jgi:xylulokinase
VRVLAIDLGTSGVKVAVVDEDGTVVAAAHAPLTTHFTDDGGAEQDPEQWWTAIGECSRRLDGRSTVEAVAVTAQYMSIVPTDRTGHPVGDVIMWMDRRGSRHLRAAAPDLDLARWLERTGIVPAGACDQAHIAFLAAERPDVHTRAAAFVEPADHLTARLTGRITATQTTAFPLMTVDNRTHGATEHDPQLVADLPVDPAQLPPLVAAGEVIGTVTSAAADHLGIPSTAQVLTGTIDSITSATGTGVIDSAHCGVIIGTTSVIVTNVDAMLTDLEHGLLGVPSPLPGRWFVMAENGVGGRAVELFTTTHGVDIDTAEAEAATSPPGANGVLFLPWLAGSIAPAVDGRARGGFLNLGLTTTRADLARAVYEGVALNAAWLLPHVEALAGADWPAVRFGGGGATSALWAQVLADVLGRRVDRLAEPRTTNARGAALLALAQLGRIAVDDIPAMVRVERSHEPDAANHERHAADLEQLVAVHAALKPFHAAKNRRG